MAESAGSVPFTWSDGRMNKSPPSSFATKDLLGDLIHGNDGQTWGKNGGAPASDDPLLQFPYANEDVSSRLVGGDVDGANGIPMFIHYAGVKPTLRNEQIRLLAQHDQRQKDIRNAQRIRAFIDQLSEMEDADQNDFLASLSAADRAGIEIALRELDAELKAPEAAPQPEVTSTPYHMPQMHEDMLVHPPLSQPLNNTFRDHGVGGVGEPNQTPLQDSIPWTRSLTGEMEERRSLKHTGSNERIKQQLGLTPEGLVTEPQISQPSREEMQALQQLGYTKSQAMLICMVDALTKQGLSPQEAQAIATKSAARSLAGWYQEADAVEQMNRERTMRFDAPLPISSIPPRVVLPLNSLHEQMKRIEPIFSVDDAAAKAEQIDNTSAVSVFAKLRHNADERDRSLLTETHGDDLDSKLREKRSSEQRSGVETDPNKLFGQKQNKASQLPVLPEGETYWVDKRVDRLWAACCRSIGLPSTDIAQLSITEKVAILSQLSDEDQAEMLTEIPKDEIDLILDMLENQQLEGEITSRGFAKLSPLLQGIVLGVPVPDRPDLLLHRENLVMKLPELQRRALQSFRDTSIYKKLVQDFIRWQSSKPPDNESLETEPRPLGWFKSMTCHQQALFLVFLSEDVASDPEIHRDELLESLSPDQVGALSDFSNSEEAVFLIEALSRQKQFQSVPVPGKEEEEEDLLKEDLQISPQIGRVQFKFDRVKDVKADAELSKHLIEQKKAEKEEALKQNQHMWNPMQNLFDKFDTDGSGTLEFAEFEQACELMNLSFSKTELKMMFMDVDADVSGAIDVNEFTELMTTLRFKRMNMVQTGQWVETKANKALTEVVFGGAYDWSAQMEWLNHSISTAGALHQSANEQGVEVQGSNFEAFRKRLRIMFEDIDLDQSESLSVEELRRALNGFGLVLEAGTMSDFFASMDADGNGEIDYQEFEDAMLDLFFNRKNAGRSSEKTPEWKKKFVQKLDSRLRPPPPERPKTVTSRCGSVKPTEDCSIQERHTMQYSYGKWQMATTTEDRPMDLVKIKITCANIPQLMDKLKRKSAIPGFPCRPVVVLNVQDPGTKVWFKVGQSDWLSGIVHPFEFCIECDYFKQLQEMELVAYDLEQGGHDEDAMEHSGTAMIGIQTIWIPKRQEGSDITQKNTTKDLIGKLHVKAIGGRQFPKSDVFGLSDPFATFTIGNDTRKTRVEMCTLDPVWGDEFEFQITGREQTIKVEAFDWDFEFDDFLGGFTVDLDYLCQSEKKGRCCEHWYHLRKKDHTFVWGMKVADEEMAAKLRKEKEILRKRAAMKSNIFSKASAVFKDFKSKSKVIPCKDVRNLIATPECCLGSIKISFRELNKALIESREQRLKAEAQKKIMESEQRGKDVGISQNMLSVLSTFTRGDTIGVAAVFSEWKQLVIREKATRYFVLSNHPDKYASLNLEVNDSFTDGVTKVRIEVGCRKMLHANSKFSLFGGSVDCFLKFEVEDEEATAEAKWEREEMHVRNNTGDTVMRKYLDQKEKFAKILWKCIHRTEVVECGKNYDGFFAPFNSTIQQDFNGQESTVIRISAWEKISGSGVLIGWVKTSIAALDHISRKGGSLPFRNGDDVKGELVVKGSSLTSVAMHTMWTFNFNTSVHSWERGDCFLGSETEMRRIRASSTLREAEVQRLTAEKGLVDTDVMLAVARDSLVGNSMMQA